MVAAGQGKVKEIKFYFYYRCTPLDYKQTINEMKFITKIKKRCG